MRGEGPSTGRLPGGQTEPDADAQPDRRERRDDVLLLHRLSHSELDPPSSCPSQAFPWGSIFTSGAWNPPRDEALMEPQKQRTKDGGKTAISRSERRVNPLREVQKFIRKQGRGDDWYPLRRRYPIGTEEPPPPEAQGRGGEEVKPASPFHPP